MSSAGSWILSPINALTSREPAPIYLPSLQSRCELHPCARSLFPSHRSGAPQLPLAKEHGEHRCWDVRTYCPRPPKLLLRRDELRPGKRRCCSSSYHDGQPSGPAREALSDTAPATNLPPRAPHLRRAESAPSRIAPARSCWPGWDP